MRRAHIGMYRIGAPGFDKYIGLTREHLFRLNGRRFHTRSRQRWLDKIAPRPKA